MHDLTRGDGPCGLPDGHRGNHRSIASAEAEGRRRRSRQYLDTVARYDNAHPAQRYLRSLRAKRKAVAA